MNFEIGLSALRASRFAIDSVSHNLANSETEGFHRQEVIFESSQLQLNSGGYRRIDGMGVSVSEIRRYRSLIVESSLTQTNADLGHIEQQLNIESEIEALISADEFSIKNSLSSLFDEFTRLAANPGERTLRNSILSKTSNLADRIRETSNQLSQMKSEIKQQLDLDLDTLNRNIGELVDIQNEIRVAGDSRSIHDKLDKRDQLINRIAEHIDIQRNEYVQDQLGLSLAGGSINLDSTAIEFESELQPSGEVIIKLKGSDREIKLQGGSIAALVEGHNVTTENYARRLDEFAQQLIRQFDQLHATGIGPNGGFTSLTGTRAVSDTSMPLAESSAFPIEPGDLFISVTDDQNNTRTHRIAVDPSVDSLADLASSISGLDHVQAIVNPETNRLSMFASPGYQLDFVGSLESTPNLDTFLGSSEPTIGGTYQGTTNEDFSVTATIDGVVGKTEGLTFEIRDTDGNLVQEIDAGLGYEAGSPIELNNGVVVQFSIGDIQNGDSFNLRVVATPDTSGLLAAVGINSLFQGTTASDIAINDQIKNSPGAIATARTGSQSDTRNLEGIIALRQTMGFGDRDFTFESYLDDLNAEIGFQVQTTISIQEGLSDLQFQYETERESISGVDANEELIRLSQHQKTYEAAVQVVRTMETMMDELFTILR